MIVEEQLKRVEKMKKAEKETDFSKLKPIIIGLCWGDGIGPVISKHAQKVLEHMLKDEVARGKVEFKDIPGLALKFPADCIQCRKPNCPCFTGF